MDELLIETINKNETKRLILASINSKHIGHITFSLGFKGNENEIDLETIGVDEVHQRRGIANLMLEYLLANYGEFTIQSGASNDAARLLQEKVGFTTIAPYRLKKEGSIKNSNRSLKSITPPTTTYNIPRVIIKVNDETDLETMYQMSKGDLKLLRKRLDTILSSAYDGIDSYAKSDYPRLYNQIESFLKNKIDEQLITYPKETTEESQLKR